MRKNILLLVTASYGGGAENYVLDFVKHYDQKRFGVSLVTLREGNIEDQFRQVCAEHGAEYLCFGQKGRISLRSLVMLMRLIKRKKVNVIHANLIEAELYAFLMKLRYPSLKYIATKHNANPFRKGILGRVDKLISSNANVIIAVSESLKQFLVEHEHLDPSRIRVIPNGLRIEDFITLTTKAQARTLLLLKDEFVVGIVGRLNPQKNHAKLFEAVKLASSRIHNIVLLVVGDGELMDSLKAKAEEMGIKDKVRFLGYRKDITSIYPAMDVMCLPSLYEGFGRVFAEALLGGAFVVGADVGGPRDIIRNGKDGFLINPEDPMEIADRLVWVRDHPKDAVRMLVTGRERVKDNFAVESVVGRIEEAYA